MAAKKSAALNIDALAASVAAQEEGREVAILNAEAGEPLGLSIVVAGIDSERYRIAWRAEIKALAAEGSLESLSPARDAESKRRIAAACVLSWEPNIILGGKTLDAGAVNAEAVFKAIPMIFDQVYGAILNRAGFTKR